MKKKCAKCGIELPNDARFCFNCGSNEIVVVTEESDINEIEQPNRNVQRNITNNTITNDSVRKNEISQTQKKKNPFFLILSWIVMIAIFLVLVFLIYLIGLLANYVMTGTSGWTKSLRIITYILGGSAYFFGLIICPIGYGVPLLISASNKVYKSPKGTRYLVFGIIIIVYYLFYIITDLIYYDNFFFNGLLYIALGITLIVWRKKI